MTLHLALYQPDIPQNLGSMLRLCACMGVTCHVIEPCGFPLDDKRIRRAGMDYIAQAELIRHVSWDAFQQYVKKEGVRLILLTTKASEPYTDIHYAEKDMLLMGRESAGVPLSVAEACDRRVTILMKGAARSLNVAMASAIVLGEAVRQRNNNPPTK